MPVIPQNLNINNLRTTKAKSINLHTIRKLITYRLKNVLVQAMFTLTVFEILLFGCRSVLLPAQWVTGSERVNSIIILSVLLLFIYYFIHYYYYSDSMFVLCLSLGIISVAVGDITALT